MATPSNAKSKSTPSVTALRAAPLNKIPVASNDMATATVLLNATGNLLTNDRDGDKNDKLTVIAAGQGAETSNPLLSPVLSNDSGITLTGIYGTLLIKADGSYTYTINAEDADFKALARGAAATENFTYQISDGQGGSDKATLKIKVTGANHGPQAADDDLDTIGNVLTNDRDIDAGDRLTVVAAGKGAELVSPELTAVPAGSKGIALVGTYGTLLIKSTGAYVYTLDTQDADYLALGKGVVGSERFTYLVSDGKGGSDKATLSIKVTGINDKLLAVDDAGATGNVLSNDIDADVSDRFTVSAAGVGAEASRPVLGAVSSGSTGTSLVGTYGTLVIKADGTYAYTQNTADADFRALGNGVTATDSFTYEATDGQGSSDKATLAITVTGINHQPVAMDDTGATGNVLFNDQDADVLDTLSVTAAGKGAELLDPVLVPVLPTQTPGSGTTIAGTYGNLVISANGSYFYQVDRADADFLALAKGQSAMDTFTYQVTDSRGVSDKATLTVQVTGINRPPVAVDDAALHLLGVKSTGNVLTNDSDVEVGASGSVDLLKVTAAGPGSGLENYDLIQVPTGSEGIRLYGTYGSLSILSDGSYKYTDNYDSYFSGFDSLPRGVTAVDSFTYQVSDGQGGFDTANVGFTVTGVNYLSQANDDSASAGIRATTPTGNVLTNDVDLDTGDSLRVTAVIVTDDCYYDSESVPAGETGTSIEGLYGTLQIKADGSYKYTLDTADWDFMALSRGEVGTDYFEYEITDGHGSFDQATLSVDVTGINDNPVARNDSGFSGNVLWNDSDVDDDGLLFVVGAKGDTGVSAVPSGATYTELEGVYGSLYIRANGDYFYETNTNDYDYQYALFYGESATDVFAYRISDLVGGAALANITVDVLYGNSNQRTYSIVASDFAADSSPLVPESLLDGTIVLPAQASQAQSLTADPFALTVSGNLNTAVKSADLETDLKAVADLFNSYFTLSSDRADDDALLVLESSDNAGDFGVYQFVSGSDGVAITADELTLLAAVYNTGMGIDDYTSSIASTTV